MSINKFCGTTLLTLFLLLLILMCGSGAHAAYTEASAKSALYFSKAAYCEAPSILNWTCPSCTEHPSFNSSQVFENKTEGTQGYIGVSRDHIVVSFRGSENIANWVGNINFIQVHYSNTQCVGCSVHGGFLGAFLSLRDSMRGRLQQLVGEYPQYPVLITGHSLGGAMALLAAADFATQSYSTGVVPKIELYTFGAPRVGNSAFTKWVAEIFCTGGHESYRVTHKQDVVPHVPPTFFGFEHHSQELWYANDTSTDFMNCVDISKENCSNINVTEDDRCSNSVAFFPSMEDHLLYLGVCTSCTCDLATISRNKELKLSPRIQRIASLDSIDRDSLADDKRQMLMEMIKEYRK